MLFCYLFFVLPDRSPKAIRPGDPRDPAHCLGGRSEEASSGEECLDQLHRAVETGDPFAAAVLDMQMPGTSGDDQRG